MSIKVQASFSAGELDPALHERTTLDKYKSGLATARNVMIGKTGRIISRPGRAFFVETKLSNREVLIYSPPNTGYLIEWGHQYVRIYAHEVTGISASFDYNGTLVDDHSHSFTEDDLPYIHFVTAGSYVYVFRSGSTIAKLFYGVGGGFISASSIFALPSAPTYGGGFGVAGAPSGGIVDYHVTKVVNGEESTGVDVLSSSTGGQLPDAAGDSNTIPVTCQVGSAAHNITEIRVYRRPAGTGATASIGQGAYGYIGSGTIYQTGGGDIAGTFTDLGQAADYTHQPPAAIEKWSGTRGGTDPRVYTPATGAVYQQRLLMVDSQSNPESILASRPAYLNNFYRDFPLAADSALKFKSGTSGKANVLRMIESDGLVVFTTVGIYLHTGALSTTNLSLDRKGNWLIDETVPPLAIPGGVLFVDKATNTIRHLMWSTENASYAGEELSIFNDHLFTGRRVVSWGFLDGQLPVLYVAFSDGKFASFTYERQHEMRAWTRHDSHYNSSEVVEGDDTNSILYVEEIAETKIADKTFFVVRKGTTRWIERSVPRYVSASISDENTEAHMNESIAFMDSMRSYSTLINDSLSGTDEMVVHALEEDLDDPWSGQLRIRCGTSGLFTSGSYGAVGTIMRWFHPVDGSSIDLETVERVTDNEIIVQPSAQFDSDYASLDPRLYATAATFTGLSHLEGEKVAVVVDGYVVGSPNNDHENYPDCIVTSGSLTLPSDLRGAIVHIGRPITGDWETLDIDTVEQRPTLIESKTVNKLYIKVHKSRGLYVGHKFPKDNKVAGMQSLESISIDYDVENEEEILMNRYTAPETKRIECTLPGDWSSNGRICGRQVDPIHFEVLSIIPDVDDQRR